MSEKRLKLQLHTSGPARIIADERLINRVIANLFDNELKHLACDRTVSIDLQKKDSTVSLIVQDDGAGFDPEISSQLFSRRVKGRTSSGHGLGLAFFDAVVRAHGGTVGASNSEDGGARLVVTFPCAPATVAAH
jgi:signal transduction histidine kinase